MKESSYKKVLMNFPFGYSLHRIILDSSGNPCDFEFVEVNRIFEKLTGLDSKAVLNKKASEVIPGIVDIDFEWIDYLGKIALTGARDVIEQYAEIAEKWYKINIYSPEKYYFITFITDITKEMDQLKMLDNFFTVNLDLLCITDMEGNFVKLNSAWEKTLGYKVDEIKKKKFFEYVHPDDIESTRQVLSSLKEGKEVLNFINRYKNRDGSYRWIEWRSKPYGSLVYAAARDITESIKIEMELRNSKERLESIIDGTNAGTWEWNIQTGEAVFNERWAEIIGYTLEELMPVSIETWKKFTHPDDLKDTEFLLEKHFSGETDYYEAECRMEHKNGGWVWIVDRGRVTERDSKGKPVLMFGTHIDITAERETQLKIEETNSKLDFLLSESPSVIYSYEITGNTPAITYISQNIKNLLGYNPDDFINSSEFWFKNIHPDDKNEVLDSNKKLLKDGYLRREYRLKNSAGIYRWLHDELHLAKGKKSGASDTVIGSWIDITDRKSIEQELEELNRFNRLILDNAPFGIVVYNRYGNTIMANNESVSIIGAPDKKTIFGQNFKKIPAWKKTGLVDAAEKVFEQKISTRLSVHLQSSFGKTLWIDIVMVPLEIGSIPHLMVIFRDITEQVLSDKALKESEENFRQLAENIEEAFWLRTRDRILYVSPGYETIWGRSCESLYADPDSFLDSVHPDDIKNVKKEFIENMGKFNLEYRIIRSDGEERWVWARTFTVKNDSGKDERIAGIAADVTDKKLLESRLKEISIRDPLTNNYNRRYIFERLQATLDRYNRDNSIFSVAIIDLDYFKIINDNYGHLAGDYVLTEFSNLLGSHIRPYDLCGRYGGEEFLIVLLGIDREKSASTMERVLKSVRNKAFIYNNQKIKITFSCGITDASEIDKGETSIEKLIAVADSRLYEAKQTGRNRIVK